MEIVEGLRRGEIQYDLMDFKADLITELSNPENFDLVYRALLWIASRMPNSHYLEVEKPKIFTDEEWSAFVEQVDARFCSFAHVLSVLINISFWQYMREGIRGEIVNHHLLR